MSAAIQELTHEHGAIIVALNVLEGMDRQLAAGSPVDPADALALVDFLRVFADTCHHGKEEALLFPALQAAGRPDITARIEGLLREHGDSRGRVREMHASLQPTLDPARFSAAARDYVQTLRLHIRHENELLFPLAESVLTPAQLASLHEAFEAHEREVIGAGRHEALHARLEQLKKRYAG